MKNIVLFDTPERHRALLPLTFTRPAALMRCGILTIARKWELLLGGRASHLTTPLLSAIYTPLIEDDNLFVAGHLLPTPAMVGAVVSLTPGDALRNAATGELLAYRGASLDDTPKAVKEVADVCAVNAPQDIFLNNAAQIEADFGLVTAGRKSAPLPPHCTLIGDPSRLFIEEGAVCTCATFNVAEGSIYIGRGAEVMEGASLRGPVSLGDHAVLKMGARVYPGTTVGPWCKVGGELSNAVIFGYSNKAHDGFLGNAVVGEWCNLGAGCVASNLKNDYSLIRLWNYADCRFARTSMQFCGLIMGDHSKAGINTMFNTATVVGVGCNIHGAGFPRTFIPSFSQGGAAGLSRVPLDKMLATARTVMARRHIELTEADVAVLTALYALDDNANPPK